MLAMLQQPDPVPWSQHRRSTVPSAGSGSALTASPAFFHAATPSALAASAIWCPTATTILLCPLDRQELANKPAEQWPKNFILIDASLHQQRVCRSLATACPQTSRLASPYCAPNTNSRCCSSASPTRLPICAVDAFGVHTGHARHQAD